MLKIQLQFAEWFKKREYAAKIMSKEEKAKRIDQSPKSNYGPSLTYAVGV